MSSLAAMMAAMAAEQAGDAFPILPEAAIARLREARMRYVERQKKGNPFRPGQIVTPIVDGAFSGAGEPFIVLESRDVPIFVSHGEVGTTEFGRQLDLYVAALKQGTIGCLWVESWQFEPYTGEGA